MRSRTTHRLGQGAFGVIVAAAAALAMSACGAPESGSDADDLNPPTATTLDDGLPCIVAADCGPPPAPFSWGCSHGVCQIEFEGSAE